MENLETYLKNLYNNYTYQELEEELTFFVERGYCANNTNKEQYSLQIQVIKDLLNR
jgi:hypothetical protein